MLSINEVKRVIEKEVASFGYNLKERKSVSTDSWYFEISNGKSSLLFRVATHKTYKNVSTLRIDRKLTHKDVIAFARKKCHALGYRFVKERLGVRI